jgi:hypothetical protein
MLLVRTALMVVPLARLLDVLAALADAELAALPAAEALLWLFIDFWWLTLVF